MRESSARGVHVGIFIPMLLVVGVILAQTVQDNLQLRRSRTALDMQYANQQTAIQSAQKVRSQLQAIAGDLAVLADRGNKNAIKLRDYLRQQGVNIQAPKASQP